MALAESDAANNYVNFSNDNWLLSVDQWCVIEGLPTNFSSHYVMMSSYFDQEVSVLSIWDHGAPTNQQYAMAMLYSMNTSDPTATSAEAADLVQEYNNIKAECGLTDSQINTFNISQLTAPSSSQLPGGCK